jgi:hypothetical protein
LLVTAITPMGFLTSYRSSTTQHRCTATMPKNLCMPAAAVLLCKTS